MVFNLQPEYPSRPLAYCLKVLSTYVREASLLAIKHPHHNRFFYFIKEKKKSSLLIKKFQIKLATICKLSTGIQTISY